MRLAYCRYMQARPEQERHRCVCYTYKPAHTHIRHMCAPHPHILHVCASMCTTFVCVHVQRTYQWQREAERRTPDSCSPTYVSIRQHTSASVSIRQHTSAHVSIRQHASAYVSIRQHTSAYVEHLIHALPHFVSDVLSKQLHTRILEARVVSRVRVLNTSLCVCVCVCVCVRVRVCV